MSTFSSFTGQSFRLPPPPLTEKNLPNQAGRVFIITGGYAGVGLDLAHILYSHDGTVYIAGRSPSKATAAIDAIRASFPASKGRLEFLRVDLADLSTIQPAGAAFLAREPRLDVLTNNAGVMTPPAGARSAQGHELQLATNVLGHHLLTQQLLPLLRKTAAAAPAGSVCVTWAASLAVDLTSPANGVAFDDAGAPVAHTDQNLNYGQSKAGNVFLASELARREGGGGGGGGGAVVTNAWNPGNLRTELQRHQGWLLRTVLDKALLYESVYGAYTVLWAGWAEEAGRAENSGRYVAPWGRFHGNRKDVEDGRRSGEEGGTGAAAMLWDWCEKETRAFV